MKSFAIPVLFVWASLALFTLYRIATPPAPDSLELEPGTRAEIFRHLELIAAEPHPIGSAAHARVRQHLVDEIERMGLPVELQQAPLGRFRADPRWATPDDVLTNVMTRIDGGREGPALLLVSHYDSAPESPGAGDDGAAVASMLTLLRTTARRGFQNDLIFLFTDAEENCLCGALAFVREHPWAADVGVVLNFEARGTAGKSVMFEATPGHGKLVKAYARNAVQPATSSLYQTVYELLPNDTDLSAFRQGGKQGLNMAFIDAQHNYHTASDSVANLDPGSVLHQHANMRAMLLALADADLANIAGDNPVFFDLLGFGVVVYSPLLAQAGLAAVLVLLAYLAYGAGTQQRVRPVALALAMLLLVAGGVVVVSGMQALSAMVTTSAAAPPLSARKYYLAACMLLGMLAFGALRQLAARRIGAEAFDLAAWLLWSLLLAATTLLLPKVSYIFLWPLLTVLVARCIHVRSTALRAVIELCAYVALVLLWTQLAYALLLAMSMRDIVLVVTPMLLATALMQTSRVGRGAA